MRWRLGEEVWTEIDLETATAVIQVKFLEQGATMEQKISSDWTRQFHRTEEYARRTGKSASLIINTRLSEGAGKSLSENFPRMKVETMACDTAAWEGEWRQVSTAGKSVDYLLSRMAAAHDPKQPVAYDEAWLARETAGLRQQLGESPWYRDHDSRGRRAGLGGFCLEGKLETFLQRVGDRGRALSLLRQAGLEAVLRDLGFAPELDAPPSAPAPAQG